MYSILTFRKLWQMPSIFSEIIFNMDFIFSKVSMRKLNNQILDKHIVKQLALIHHFFENH